MPSRWSGLASLNPRATPKAGARRLTAHGSQSRRSLALVLVTTDEAMLRSAMESARSLVPF